MMKLLAMIIICLMSVCVFAQEQEEAQNVQANADAPEPSVTPDLLAQIADDTKFNNAVYFLRLKKISKAAEELQEYLEIYYYGSHRNEAWNKLAAIYYDRMDYLKAISFYERLYEEFATGEDGASACFNMGLCYAKMGYDAEAADMFVKITAEYPSSSYAARARDQLKLLNMLGE